MQQFLLQFSLLLFLFFCFLIVFIFYYRYYECKIDEILEDGTCTVKFDSWGDTEVTNVSFIIVLNNICTSLSVRAVSGTFTHLK